MTATCKRRGKLALLGTLALAVMAAMGCPSGFAHDFVRLASSGVGGIPANNRSVGPQVSNDGRYVAFTSYASNLVVGDTNRQADVFVRDFQTGITERINLGPGGVQANGTSYGVQMSADGRFVLFASHADNLVLGDTNGGADVFLADRMTGTLERVSLGDGGVQTGGVGDGGSMSASARCIAFTLNATPNSTAISYNVYVYDRERQDIERVSKTPSGGLPNDWSYAPAIAANGRFVVFTSLATDLLPGMATAGQHTFVYDRQTGTTSLVDVAADGGYGDASSYGGSPSGDGRFIAFVSYAGNLVPHATNGLSRVYVRDQEAGTTKPVDVSSTGVSANKSSSGVGLSRDGRFVAFSSDASNLVPGDTNRKRDVFRHDRKTGTTRRISLGPGGAQGNDISEVGGISPNGHYVGFLSHATNLVPGDSNGYRDAFLWATLR